MARRPMPPWRLSRGNTEMALGLADEVIIESRVGPSHMSIGTPDLFLPRLWSVSE